MSWTHDIVIKLISAYRKREILWNPKDPNYFNKKIKGQAWKEIAQELDKSVMAVKSKVEILSGQLRSEKSRLLKMSKRVGAHVSSSWYAYEHLKFLLNRQPHKRLSNEDTNVKSETQDPQVPQTSNLSNESTKKLLTPKKKNKHTENRMTKSDMDSYRRKMKSAAYATDVLVKSETDSSATDADQIYANFITTKFRMYSQRTKNILQHKISNLLFQADTGLFDNDQSNASSQQKTRASRTESRQPRTNESDSPSSSPDNKRARRSSSEDWPPIILKIEENSDSEDPLNYDYED